jgi:uracil-DNA glycosylase family 4
MCNSVRVLGHSAGSLDAKVMFIGEAPGRLGADQTQIPFHGDVAGGNFEDFLQFAGIHRGDIFVTNAVLCNPRDSKGNNSSPTIREIESCAAYLRRQIELVNPEIVVSLGAVALRALATIEPHGLTLSAHVRTAHRWNGRELIPLYHPGQRALIHRSRPNQRSDYQFVAERMRRAGRKPRKPSGITPAELLDTCRYLLSRKGELSYFELHKFAYLMEYVHVKETGRRLSSAHFLRQKDGPYCIELQIDKLRRADPSISLRKMGDRLLIRRAVGSSGLFGENYGLAPQLSKLADEVLERYSYSSEADLKRAVYLTAPMRLILRRERAQKTNLYNSAIEFLSA